MAHIVVIAFIMSPREAKKLVSTCPSVKWFMRVVVYRGISNITAVITVLGYDVKYKYYENNVFKLPMKYFNHY